MTSTAKQIRLTEKRARILADALKSKLGVVSNPYVQGFQRVSWDQNAAYLVSVGLLEPYVHGGFAITDAGRERAA